MEPIPVEKAWTRPASLVETTIFCLLQFLKIYILAAFYLLKELLLRIRSGKWPAAIWKWVDMANGGKNKQILPNSEGHSLHTKQAYLNGASWSLDAMKELLIHKNLIVADLPLWTKGVAIVTGGSGGLGFEVIQELLSRGIYVIVGVQNEVEENLLLMKRKERKCLHSYRMEVWHMDLSSMMSVQLFANRFIAMRLPLHLLINCAGIMCAPYKVTEDGFESHFAINYLSHCLLIKLLLPCLKIAGTARRCARIVTVASSVHFAGHINFGDLQSRHCYSSHHAYMQSKLALVMFTYSLQQYLQSENCYITANCLHPGVTNTALYKYIWWAPLVASYFFKTPKEGAETVLYAALSPELERKGGFYLEEMTVSQSSTYSHNQRLQNCLWKETWELLKTWLDTLPPL